MILCQLVKRQDFVDGSDSESKENIIYGEYEKRIVGFLKEALGIK